MGRHYVNLFELTNLSALETAYRLLAVQGLPQDDNYEKNLNLLTKRLAYELRQPVALVAADGKPAVAIPADSPLPALRQRLTPYIATLAPEEAVHFLRFDRLSSEIQPIAISFLHYAFGTPLMQDGRLWGANRRYFAKRPVNEERVDHDVDIFGGFRYKIVALEDGRLFLAVDLAYKYVDRRWLTEHLRDYDLSDFLMRHCLYLFGDQWYEVQLLCGTGLSIGEQEFEDHEGQVWDVFTYTRAKCGEGSPWITALDPKGLAIQYRKPGQDGRRYGAAALCKLIYRTQDPRIQALHKGAMRPPDRRFTELSKIMERYFSRAKLGRVQIQMSSKPLEVPKCVFPVPDQRFGHGKILHVRRSRHEDGIDLEDLGRTRLNYLLDRGIGLLTAERFGAQYVLIPESLPRGIVEEFLTAFQRTMEQLVPQPYMPTRILYADPPAVQLRAQVQAIEEAVAGQGISRGYALLILPFQPHPDLHNFLKRRYWPDLQFQCALAVNIEDFFEVVLGKDGTRHYRLKDGERGKFRSYLLHTAIGLLLVNRMWPWGLENALTYDVYIGVDVLNGRACFTFLYNNAQTCYVRDFPSQQREKLTARQMRTVLYESLAQDLRELGIRPRAVIVHRDGRAYESERRGIRGALERLIREGLLDPEAVWGVVEIHKHSAASLRMAAQRSDGHLVNPRVGSYFPLNPHEGIVCNTGWPFRLQGTAKPLHVVIVEGSLNIEAVLRDTFALSQPWFAPMGCSRLPLTIKLADHFLEPIAGRADLEEALYGEEEIEEEPEENAEG